MTPRASRLLRLLSHVSPVALTAGAETLQGHIAGALPKPQPGFKWHYTGRAGTWPLHKSMFTQRYAGSLVGFA